MTLQKKWLCLLVTVIATVFIAGCINFTYKTEINPDESGKQTVDMALDKNFQSLLESSTFQKGAGGSFEDQLKKNLPEGGKFRTYTKGNKKHYEISFEFDNIEELRKINQQMNKDSQGPQVSQVDLTKKDYLVLATYTFSEKFPASEVGATQKQVQQGLSNIFSLDYTLKMPGSITSSNADEVKGDTATWHLNISEGGDIKAISRYVRWWVIILIAALVLLVIIILIAGGAAALVRRKKSPAEAEPAPEAKTEPKSESKPKSKS